MGPYKPSHLNPTHCGEKAAFVPLSRDFAREPIEPAITRLLAVQSFSVSTVTIRAEVNPAATHRWRPAAPRQVVGAIADTGGRVPSPRPQTARRSTR